MELTLALITLASLAIATAMSLVAWKVVRDARERTLARAEVLRALAEGELAEPPAPAVPVAPERASRAPRLLASLADVHEPVVTRFATLDFDAPDADGAPGDAEADIAWGSPAVTGAAMFEAAAEPRAPGRRWLALAAVGLFMAAGAGGMYALHASGGLPGLTAVAPDASGAARPVAPLELLSLSNSIDQTGNFTVTGLVDNPPGGRPLRGVVAVVYLFDLEGHYVASGRANLDQSALAPGAQSPFAVSVAVGTAVSRYRIGFRLQDGDVVQHVDRRSSPAAQGPANAGHANGA
jgi:hypothetical protein